ncbi:MAG: pyridoxal-phosphate dependent enzyme [Bradymonadaceae bacterium]|nr:pyridoxal-phosphate dependent enzyme [Lujinxingiaceae bacterium]
MSSKSLVRPNDFVPASGPAPVLSRMDELVGNTPLVRLTRLGDATKAPIYIKMENLNPSGSMRDRYVAEILERAVLAGNIVAGDSVALAGLDDSAVAAALFGSVLAIKVRVFAPADSSKRLLPIVERYGGELVWTPAEAGIEGAIEEAAQWTRQGYDRTYVDGYRRQAVRDAYSAIASEILQALEGRVLGAFITSVTTGGTFRHVARELRQTYPSLQVGGAVLIDVDYPDLVEHQFNLLRRITFAQTWEMRDELARTEGLMLGPKGAACVKVALDLQQELSSDEIIVALNPDSGQRYLGWENKPLFATSYVPQQ